jgi:hypothetical protein
MAMESTPDETWHGRSSSLADRCLTKGGMHGLSSPLFIYSLMSRTLPTDTYAPLSVCNCLPSPADREKPAVTGSAHPRQWPGTPD